MNSFFFLRKMSSFCVKLDFLYLLRFMKEKEMSFLQFAVTLQNAITWFWYIFIFWLLNLKKFNKNYHTKKKNQMYKNNKRNEQIEQAHRIFKKKYTWTKQKHRSNENVWNFICAKYRMLDKATSWQIQLISTYKKQNKQMTPKSAIHCFYWYFYVNRTKNTNLSNFTHSIKNSQI